MLLLEAQASLTKEISVIKAGQWTSKRITKLDSIKARFVANQASLLKCGVVDHDYFNNKLFEEICKVVETFKRKFASLKVISDTKIEKKAESDPHKSTKMSNN